MFIFGKFYPKTIITTVIPIHAILSFIMIAFMILSNYYQGLFLYSFLKSGITFTELRGEDEVTEKVLPTQIENNDLSSNKLENVIIEMINDTLIKE